MRKRTAIMAGGLIGATIGVAIGAFIGLDLGAAAAATAGAAAGSAAGEGLASLDREQAPKTVEHVDLGRYAGQWYEIARYPNRFEGAGDRDVTAEYSLARDGKIRVVNTCISNRGRVKRVTGTARVTDTATNAKLKVAFFWPFYGDYWILEVGPEYEYAVVGGPSREYLWILGRSPVMTDTVYEGILQRLSENSYDPARLVKTRQTLA